MNARKPKPNHRSRNVRPGKPSGVKSTAKETEKRVREVAELICDGHVRSSINDIICKKYGVHWQTVTQYCLRARELLIAESGKPKEEHRAEVIGKYQQILRDKKAGRSDKLQALKGKRDVLGLDAPKRAEISGPDGGTIKIERKHKGEFDQPGFDRLCAEFFGIPETNGIRQPVHPSPANGQTGAVPGHDGQ